VVHIENMTIIILLQLVNFLPSIILQHIQMYTLAEKDLREGHYLTLVRSS
jgi:hypothetical protein